MRDRPIYLNLFQIRLPLPAWVSFMHRVSGAALFLALPVLLFAFDRSLSAQQGFAALQGAFSHWSVKLISLGLLWAFFHHFFAGIRHLLMDIYNLTDLGPGRVSAALALALGIVVTLLAGVRLW